MTRIRSSESIRRFIIENVANHPSDIVRLAADRFGCTRQAVHRHVRRMVAEGALAVSGNTRSRRYVLAPLVEMKKFYRLADRPTEDRVWREDVAPLLHTLPENVVAIWQYGFTEMFNNVIDHADATEVVVSVTRTAATTTISLLDDGVGIFRKIKAALGLADERHAVLELAKGKLTTDPRRHSGEGIFFTSRMFDEYDILSGDVFFSHEFGKNEDWILQMGASPQGTMVSMVLDNHTARTSKQVFDAFTVDENYGFSKTVVPVKLLSYGDDQLISRSQAKRLLARFDRFQVVVLDFDGVSTIGQAFADEVFRVFASEHPNVELVPMHATADVMRMIARALQH